MKSTHLNALFLAKRNVPSAKAAPCGRPFRYLLTATVLAASFGIGTAGAASPAADSQSVKADTREAVAKTKEVASDSWITTKVKSEIMADSVSKGFEVGVVTTGAAVALKGELASPEAITRVREIAASVEGVKRVDTTGLRVQARK